MVQTEESVVTPPSDESEPTGVSGAARARPRWTTIAAIAAVVIVIAVVVWLLWPSSTGVPSKAQPNSLAPQAVTTVGGQALLSTLRTGEAATYHVAFKVVGDAKQIGGTLTLEIWQAPPETREDTVLVRDGTTTRAESFSSSKSGHLCTQSGSGAWTCRTLSAAEAADAGAAGILTSISGEISGHGVSMRKQTIDGYSATCFTVQTSEQPELCATADGIPVLIADNEVRYQLVSLSNSVSSSEFTLPAHG